MLTNLTFTLSEAGGVTQGMVQNKISQQLLVCGSDIHDFSFCPVLLASLQRVIVSLLCPVFVSLEQQHETKTNSLFAAECMLQLELQ